MGMIDGIMSVGVGGVEGCVCWMFRWWMGLRHSRCLDGV